MGVSSSGFWPHSKPIPSAGVELGMSSLCPFFFVDMLQICNALDTANS